MSTYKIKNIITKVNCVILITLNGEKLPQGRCRINSNNKLPVLDFFFTFSTANDDALLSNVDLYTSDAKKHTNVKLTTGTLAEKSK